VQVIEANRRELQMKALNYWFFLILGLVFIGVGVFGAYALAGATNNNPLVLPAVLLFPLGFGAYLMTLALRSRVVVDGPRIEVRTPFGEKTADASEVEGYRDISTRNGSFWRLQLKEGRGSITIQKWFDSPELRAWLQQITDIDERDRKAILDEIEQNQELGATPEERLSALKQASQWNIGLTAVAIAAAICRLFPQNALFLPAAFVLALTPLAILYLMHRSPLLFVLGKPKRDPRTDFTFAFMAAGVGLFLGNIGVNFISLPSLFPAILLVSLATCAGLFLVARNTSGPRGAWIVIVMLSGSYGYGLVTSGDTLPDHAKPERYSASIVGKHTTSGRSTTYYLDLAPWGPIADDNRLGVSKALYDAAGVGDLTCLELHQGYLNAPWYRQVECVESGSAPGDAPAQ
jgi:hypothetical protein